MRQLRRDDCGVACVAMVAGISYGAALEAFSFTGESYHTSADDLVRALSLLGIRAGPKLMSLPGTGRRWMEEVRVLSKPAILKSPTRRDGTWHWRVYDPSRKIILDPRSPPYSRLRVSAYLLVESEGSGTDQSIV